MERSFTPLPLSNWGYNLVLNALARQVAWGFARPAPGGKRRPENNFKQLLLWYRLQDELTMQRLGVSAETQPSDLPFINTILNHSPLCKLKSKRNLSIELAGMPNTGKDSLGQIINDLNLPWLSFSHEPYTSLKESGMLPSDPMMQEKYELAATMGEIVVAQIELRKKGAVSSGIAVVNRGFTDFPIISRAKLIFGAIPFQDFFNPDKGRIFRTTANGNNATIFFLISPAVAYERVEDKTREHKYLNPEFLSILYEQYLLAIYRLIERGENNIAVLDMSGSVEENLRKLISVIEVITERNI